MALAAESRRSGDHGWCLWGAKGQPDPRSGGQFLRWTRGGTGHPEQRTETGGGHRWGLEKLGVVVGGDKDFVYTVYIYI